MTDTPRAEEPPYDEPDQLRDQVRQLLRHPVLIVGALALGVLGGVEAHRATGDQYTASGQLLVDAPSTTPFNSSVAAGKNINMQTEQQVASSLVVADAAARALKEPGLQGSALQKRLTVAASPNTEILQLSYTDSDPVEAARRVNAVMSAYLSQRQATAAADLKGITAGLDSQLKPLMASYNSLSKQINDFGDGDGTAKDYALSERASVATQIAAVQSQLADYQAVNTTPGQILAQAAPPTAPAGISGSLLAAIGGVVGLALGILLAWLASVFERRVRDGRDVLRHLGAPILVTLPFRPGRLRPGGGLLAVGSSPSRLAEAYRTLALRVALATDQHDPRGILVVEPRTLGQAAAVAANLAAAYAETGEEVLLIEADLRRPRLRRRLAGRVGAEAVIRPGATPDGWPHRPVTVAAGSAGSFTLVPGSRVPAALRALALVDSEAEALRSGPTLVVTAPAVLSHPDALAVARWTDGVVLVGDPGGLRRTDLDQVREFLAATNTPVLGMVATRTPGGRLGRLVLRAADALRFGREPAGGVRHRPEQAGLEARTGRAPAAGAVRAPADWSRGLATGRRESDGADSREADQEWLRASLLERGSE
ncbi:lipopolysaccharide biosynthesis protein [Streptacidiphilus sp. PB12-B1b]|uniref:lipopolysaccharide biosynthesis protein n=1 Tax=Streptacidiphilus sp. PB12-B1b TaxID=2705012 RepID=UPI0015F9A0F1|nr:lipopolysaccharide biosynthesis protein [Streptacidiphilus sp. PB12-B1b]QMU77841.1 lipopolysaccharide biosynthesis protein [Streptacidiphilus sp. PB12-B1b]